MTNSTEVPGTLRRLDLPAAHQLAALLGAFDDLQSVLRCCEELVATLGADAPDEATAEALWTSALLSYARPFEGDHPVLTDDDVTKAIEAQGALDWHGALLKLRAHYAGAANPRERFTVGVAVGEDGKAAGIGVTSTRQPMVDDVTVRQTGAVAFALSNLVNDRIGEQQQTVYAAVSDVSAVELGRLPVVQVVADE